MGKTTKTVDFSNIQGSVAKSENVTFLFRLEEFLAGLNLERQNPISHTGRKTRC